MTGAGGKTGGLVLEKLLARPGEFVAKAIVRNEQVRTYPTAKIQEKSQDVYKRLGGYMVVKDRAGGVRRVHLTCACSKKPPEARQAFVLHVEDLRTTRAVHR